MKLIVIILILLGSLTLIQCDLPVHCMKHQIEGKWNVQMGQTEMTGDGMLPCGHQQPDSESTSYKSLESANFNSAKEFQLVLDANHVARNTKENRQGKWTMVYDEGFEIDYDNTKFFAFNKYTQSDQGEDGWESDCSNTLLGWWHNYNTGERGCYMRNQTQMKICYFNQAGLTQNVAQDKVVQPKISDAPQDDAEDRANAFHNEISRNIQVQNQKDENDIYHYQSTFSFAQITTKTFEKSKLQMEDEESQPDFIAIPDTYIPNSEYLQLNRDSVQHDQVVQRLNLVKDKSWSAKVHDDFKGLTLAQLNKKAGNKKRYSFLQTMTKEEQDRYAKYSRESVSDLPKEFSWQDKISPATQQKDCGSCYTIATMEMLQSRIHIQHDDPVKLSVQESLDCNYYNQGCDGGYGYIHIFGHEQCYPYTSFDGVCDNRAKQCEKNNFRRYKVGEYGYLGGEYGKSTERLMMEEIQKNGPIVVSFEPSMDFMYYERGIYHSVDPEDWIKEHEQQPEWEKVDHSVLCYGWGEDEDGKYWLLQNSWGPQWGENGSFKMRRGTDESHIESMAEFATIQRLDTSFLQTEKPKKNLQKNRK